MEVHLRLDGRQDLTEQIYRQVRAAIEQGRLRAGDQLPASRTLAKELGVSRNTVGSAYEWLAGEGLLEGRQGAGTFVSRADVRPAPAPDAVATSALRPRAFWTKVGPPRTWAPQRRRYDFRLGLPDASLFPFETWRRLLTSELRRDTGSSGYGASAGHERLRAAIARHVGTARAVQADADQVVVTGGTQQGLDLIARVLLEPGDVVAVEEPGYPQARLLFESLGMRVVPVPVDEHGLIVADLPAAARLVFVCPSHQMPLGMPLSMPRRQALLAWAEEHDAAVVEDDYDSEFRFGGRRMDALHALDAAGRVFYVGTFSKTLEPALRLGFVIAPAPLAQVLASARYLSDWHSPLAGQAAMARFIEEGLFARHLHATRTEYEARHGLLVQALSQDDASELEPISTSVGLHLTALLPDGTAPEAEQALIERAGDLGVAFYGLSRFYAGHPARCGVILGFGSIARAQIPEGVSRLLAAWRSR